MANVYQITIISMEPTANGTLNADTLVEKRISTNPDVWQTAVNGHRTVVLEATEVLAITDSTMTNAQKRTALKELIRSKVRAFGVDISDQAQDDIVGLFPTGIGSFLMKEP